ncbi:hypothetical protein ACIQVU_16105 [Lysinibacillus sp. NPDC098008]|uniref:hypothetical protein n=1 Tax=Lysinibacillus sp. NPDC098008 TaxID=3364146 RepID=UPI0038226EDE
MRINNYYNFKNPIRHFLNIDAVLFSSESENFSVKDLAHTEPFKFRILKNENKYRVLKFPNILNFYCSLNKFKNVEFFNEPNKLDDRKRLMPNTVTGDFISGAYDRQLDKDFLNLCLYDNLLRLDIKSYYSGIYTHHLNYGLEEVNIELFLTNLNSGNTNGLIMGNYISLYFAEKYLVKISNSLQKALENENISCDFQYFSDDFYIFCNERDNETVIQVFDSVLEKYNLERKEPIEKWTYIQYNEQNIAERYWKKIISESHRRFDDTKNNNNLYFINQLVYRMSNIKEEKFQRTFLNTFFKSTYFHELDITKYELQDYNFHQLCFIYKFSPETLIYSLVKFVEFENFRNTVFIEFLEARYRESLGKRFNEQQIYFYYALKLLNKKRILKKYREEVIKSENQILISYYLKDELFVKKNIDYLKDIAEESYWFQNYHLILFTDLSDDDNLNESINKYLIPKQASKDRQKNNYREFYLLNINAGIAFIKNINAISLGIEEYRASLVEERAELFGESEGEYE